MDKKNFLWIKVRPSSVIFKLNIPLSWFNMIGVNENKKDILIKYLDNRVYISKSKYKIFSDYDNYERALQVHKFKGLYFNKYDRKRVFVKKAEEYFGINNNMVYKYLKINVDKNDLNNTKLIKQVNIFEKKTKIVICKMKKSVINIPADIAIPLIMSKDKKELRLGSTREVFYENEKIPVNIEVEENKIIISKLK